jgi:hypothetical protein
MASIFSFNGSCSSCADVLAQQEERREKSEREIAR